MNKMRATDYQYMAMRTNDGKARERLTDCIARTAGKRIDVPELLNGVLGLSGETGEFLDMIKKWIFHETRFDESHAKKELGDVCWYIALISHAMGWDLGEIMEMNIAKLKLRYPDGFDVEQSQHRAKNDV